MVLRSARWRLKILRVQWILISDAGRMIIEIVQGFSKSQAMSEIEGSMRFPLGVAYDFVSGFFCFGKVQRLRTSGPRLLAVFGARKNYNHGIGLYGLCIHREPFSCTHRCVCVFSIDTAWARAWARASVRERGRGRGCAGAGLRGSGGPRVRGSAGSRVRGPAGPRARWRGRIVVVCCRLKA